MTRSLALRRASVPSAGASSDRQILDVMRERNRFIEFLRSLEREPEEVRHRLKEGIAMTRSLAHQARDCVDCLIAAGNALAANTLTDLLRSDFHRAAAITGGLVVGIEFHAE